jgi:cytochrome c oxidase subunit 2
MHPRSAPRSLSIAVFATVGAFLAISVGTLASTGIDVVVKNWSFTPATVETKVGQPTVLRFTDSEGVHGVESADLGLAKTTIMPGKVTEVTFTPKTAGTFAVHCAVVCGEGHDKMVLTVKVDP